ncbi:DUF5107 domain-containing protein [Gemmatimonadota bacterium]
MLRATEVKVGNVKIWCLLAATLVIGSWVSVFAGEVRVYESPLTLPTYRLGPPERMPAWRRIYPYTMYDKLTDERYDRTYRALWVENEYVKALVLPEIGGRLHGAQDKTNGYQFFQNQRTIKPGLVGMAGAWISGGVEYNFPHGHRPSGFRDTDWRLQENPDGSKTAWTGEIDRMFGMRWSVGHTVHPGRNWVETRHRLYNCTPYAHSFQYWATSAVRATPEYQAVIPGEIKTGHGKHEFFNWPVHEGVNQTYWKNLPGHTSFFAVDSKDDYFGGYSPEESAGIAIFSDHQVVPGKKLWTWGTAPSGRIWEKILTDGDLPYFEPQAGAFSDNQPDYHWIMPGETKVFSIYWFPVRDIGVWDYANLEGALNLELNKGMAKFGWSPTGVNKNARVIVTAGGRAVYDQKVNACPANPLLGEAKVPGGTDQFSLAITVLCSKGDTLLSFSHPKPQNPALPAPLPSDPAPEKVKSVDELNVIGNRIEMFRDTRRAQDYYNEALKRDPGDVRANTAVGLILLKQGKLAEALEYFEKSLERDPSYGQAVYYQGMASLKMGDLQKAEDKLNRAAYDLAFYASANYELAQLTAATGRYERALEHIERSISGNGDNAQAYAVKALILNRLGRPAQALATAEKIQQLDPLDLLSLAERIESLKKMRRDNEAAALHDTLLMVTRGDSENHLELAIRYARCGCYSEAVAAIGELIQGGRKGWVEEDKLSPMLYYYAAYYNCLIGNDKCVAKLLPAALEASPEYCFPNRPESFPVLAWAIEQNPGDARALYYLGNLYYAKTRVDEAIDSWNKAVAIEPGNVVAHRNLGMALLRKNEIDPAKAAYEQAIKADPGASAAALELVRLYKRLGYSSEQRLAFLKENMTAVTTNDALLTAYISLLVQAGSFDEALNWLRSHHFHSWEGRYGIHQYWVVANLDKGDGFFAGGRYEEALKHYEQSLTYPFNLEVAALPRIIHARKLYKVGTALEALGRKTEAMERYNTVVAERDTMRQNSAYRFYLGKALEKLGRSGEAQKVYQEMLDASGETRLSRNELRYDPNRNPEALSLFRRSLALEGLGRTGEAEVARKKALELDPIASLRVFSPPRAGW